MHDTTNANTTQSASKSGSTSVQRSPSTAGQSIQRSLRGADFASGAAMLAPREAAHGKVAQAKVDGAASKKEAAKASPSDQKSPAADKKAPGTGSGGRLPEGLRKEMETSFGADFSAVRIHESSARATAVQAKAYAEGFDIHFAPGQYDPQSASGRELIGHELAHVVQQQSGRVVAPLQAKGTPMVQNQALESEADQAGTRAARGQSAGIKSSGRNISRPIVQGYFTLNQQQMTELWQREQDKAQGERAQFHGQETGSDLANPNSYTNAQSQTNLVTKAQVPAVRVSEDAKMAIEDADFDSRQAKVIFMDSGLIGPSNAQLKATHAKFKLKQSGNGLQVPGPGGLKDLVAVVGQSVDRPNEMGNTLTTPMNCNEMGGAIAGTEAKLETKLTTTGAQPAIDTQDKSTRMAQYVNGYAKTTRKNQQKKKLFRKKGKKLDKQAEKEAQSSTEFTYPEPQDQEWLKPMRELTVNNGPAFKVALEKALGTNMMIWESRPDEGYFKVMFSEQDHCDQLGVDPLAAFITDTVVLPPFKDIRKGKNDKDGKRRALEGKQQEVAQEYGTMPQQELEDTTEKLGLNEYIEPDVGDALEILPVGVPDQNKDIEDHRKPQVQGDNGPEKQKISALFPYHWGGVVARSGPDYVTLENYARNEEDGTKASPTDETRSYFMMYGSKRAVNPNTKSFHEFWGRYFANPLTINHQNSKKDQVVVGQDDDSESTTEDVTQVSISEDDLDLGQDQQNQDRVQVLDNQINQAPRGKKVDHQAPNMTHEEQARVQRVKAFLQTLSNIRIGFDKSPNYGHQSATVATMEAIRDLGYTGWFECVYEPENAVKIAVLMPGDFDKDGPAVQVVNGKKLKFVAVGNKEAPKKTDTVGVMGANDHGHTSERLNVDHAMTLQPFEWHQKRRVESHGKEKDLEQGRDTEEQQRKSPLAFQYDVNSPDDSQGLVDQNLPTEPVRATNVKALLAGVEAGKFDMQALYGLTDTEAELAALVDGAKWAQNNGPTKVKCGAVVFAAIPGAPDNMVPNGVRIIDLTTPGADQTINGLGGTDIAVVKTGKLPQPIFREVYRASSLPPVLEGANTTNFMRLTGLPYLNFFTLKTPYVAPFGGDTDTDYQPVLDMLARAEQTTRSKSPQRAEAVGKVMQAAKDPDSLLVDFFQTGGEETRSAGANMVVIGLDALRAEMAKEPPKFEWLTNKGGRNRVSDSIAAYMVQRNQDLVGKTGDVETVVKHMVHESRATRKNDEALSSSAKSALRAVSRTLGKAGIERCDLGDDVAVQKLIGDVTNLRDVYANRKGGKSTAKKLTTAVDALTAMANNAPTDAPSPDKDPRGYAAWLCERAPFNGQKPVGGSLPGAVMTAALKLVPQAPVVDDGGDDTSSSED